jgi:hypothetical protein
MEDEFSLYTTGLLEDIRQYSKSVLIDTLTLYIFAGGAGATPVMTNRGGVSQTFSVTLFNIPCRVDVEIRGLVPQRTKSDIDVQKLIRHIYISRDWCIENNLVPKIKDELTISAGNPLGQLVRYRVIDVDLETDSLDVELLCEAT